ncbi:MAG: methyltransferase domain-containing protein [Coleofasciculaceae cyanobacterium SM2_1_6]|nr:methyltransferase domain-containing protein [Coleofasciculaceae cyanobacterium SM2_1_6]
MSLNQRIQQFYDNSSGLWEKIWGEHLHHGYYGATGRERKERRQAQIDLIEELLAWGGVAQPEKILDVGCGIGGSSLYLAEKYHAQVTGITLSPVQANRAKVRAASQGLVDRTNFLVADALAMPFADQSFDLVWSLESAEHFPDKKQFLQEAYRVLKPGGLLLLATWCHRPPTPATGELTPQEQKHLAEIYRVYCLPPVVSIADYETLAQRVNFQQIRTADWSSSVAPFWDAVIASAFSWEALTGLLQSNWETIEGALVLPLMRSGYQRSLIRYGLLCGTKNN